MFTYHMLFLSSFWHIYAKILPHISCMLWNELFFMWSWRSIFIKDMGTVLSMTTMIITVEIRVCSKLLQHIVDIFIYSKFLHRIKLSSLYPFSWCILPISYLLMLNRLKERRYKAKTHTHTHTHTHTKMPVLVNLWCSSIWISLHIILPCGCFKK